MCWAKVIIGDSRRMTELADESVGLVVTSPPIGISRIMGFLGRLATIKTFMSTSKIYTGFGRNVLEF
jgi:DNA modification methylase